MSADLFLEIEWWTKLIEINNIIRPIAFRLRR